jgi:transcriptional regulator with XRE-family HTH domain
MLSVLLMSSALFQQWGERVREVRLTAGLSQAVLAERIGYSRATVINIEQGRHEPTYSLIQALRRELPSLPLPEDLEKD